MLLDQVRERFEQAGHRVSQRDDVDENAAGWFLDASPRTLANWRSAKRGPRYRKLPCGVRYSLEDLLDFLQAKLAA